MSTITTETIIEHRISPETDSCNQQLAVVGSTERNPGTALDLTRIRGVQVNASAVQRRAATLPARRSIKSTWQAAWLLKAITLIDLTTLSGDDTEYRVRRLAAKARTPVRRDILDSLGVDPGQIKVAAVCVYHDMIRSALQELQGSGIPVAAVSTGFPAGLAPYPLRVQEIRASVLEGAREIDIVISRRNVLSGNWQGLYDEVREFRDSCGEARLKAIIATGELGTLRNVSRASWVCMMAGADFIKTSTGKESVNSTLSVSLTMMRCIREYFHETGYRVGFKPAGGISRAKDALAYLALLKEELGDPWMTSNLFRFGASSLLTDLERQLEHHVTGRYSAADRHAMS